MSYTLTTEVFLFDELSDSAKERAREWFRQVINDGDTSWSEYVLDDAKEIGRMLGFTVKDIYWTGFSSQGDGACIVGTWSAKDVRAAELRAHAPLDKELASIRKAMRAFARAHKENSASITHRDPHYYHEQSVSIEVDQDADTFDPIARSFMHWIYKQLEAAYEWENADEQVDENIRANEYSFTEEGKRFG